MLEGRRFQASVSDVDTWSRFVVASCLCLLRLPCVRTVSSRISAPLSTLLLIHTSAGVGLLCSDPTFFARIPAATAVGPARVCLTAPPFLPFFRSGGRTLYTVRAGLEAVGLATPGTPGAYAAGGAAAVEGASDATTAATQTAARYVVLCL